MPIQLANEDSEIVEGPCHDSPSPEERQYRDQLLASGGNTQDVVPYDGLPEPIFDASPEGDGSRGPVVDAKPELVPAPGTMKGGFEDTLSTLYHHYAD
jgi:hypothetical protein